VPETVGKVAVERGPLVYCAEAVDHDGPILRATLADNAPLTITFVPDLLNGITVIQANQRTGNLTLVPYYAWAHRGIGAMTVWFDRTT
jgi:DUF1680 family protein